MADSATDQAIDELYRAAPEEFTALRTELAKKAKQGGDAEGAKAISASRKPTTSAWVVNRLIHDDPEVRSRLADLGERLRSAHSTMDGERIRQFSGEQRRLVVELTRTAFRVAGIADPSAALRDDVTDTLQAAVADPDVTARLGRLAKAEQWSGFGEFGEISQVSTTARGSRATPKATPAPAPAPDNSADRDGADREKADRDRAEQERRERARAVLAAAERAKADADEVIAERQSDLATARLKRDDARNRLARAEEALEEAEQAYAAAKQAGRDAGAVVKEAKKGLTRG
ncbi:hypothetical protein O6P37_21375 [Mycobacterium sp. CPCC 205372]|uniref:Transposase n=1 Tax=Mycobacterium hippophais TaxID=3016340 RepID=A0ABT4PY71_9MYCO|nr:hypothetical protein [Mycobacterium hippophais]MCZ8381426.1 hypothetical protein [Mycobacterium hippophais]